MHRRIAAGFAAGALFLAAAGASFMIPSLVAAADPSGSPAATPAAGARTSSDQTPPTGWCLGGPQGGGPGMGADDITAAAKALGMTEANLTSALQSGQTLAQIAATQNVDVQKLIDAMVAAEKVEIQAQVDAGTITQFQADRRIANLTRHETDEVNGVMGGPGFGHRGPHGQPPADSSTGSTTSS